MCFFQKGYTVYGAIMTGSKEKGVPAYWQGLLLGLNDYSAYCCTQTNRTEQENVKVVGYFLLHSKGKKKPSLSEKKAN